MASQPALLEVLIKSALRKGKHKHALNCTEKLYYIVC